VRVQCRSQMTTRSCPSRPHSRLSSSKAHRLINSPSPRTEQDQIQRRANSRASHFFNSAWCGFRSTFPSLRATTEGPINTAVRRSRTQASPKARATRVRVIPPGGQATDAQFAPSSNASSPPPSIWAGSSAGPNGSRATSSMRRFGMQPEFNSSMSDQQRLLRLGLRAISN